MHAAARFGSDVIMRKVKLSDLTDDLEISCEETSSYVDLQTGEVVAVWDSSLREAEEGDEKAGEGLPDWRKKEFETARAIVASFGDRFIPAPTMYDFHEYRHMERFIGTVEDDEAVEQLHRAIKGRGAFRHFKNTASRLGLLERWFAYREAALKDFVRDWARAQEIPLSEDPPPKPGAAGDG